MYTMNIDDDIRMTKYRIEVMSNNLKSYSDQSELLSSLTGARLRLLSLTNEKESAERQRVAQYA